MIKGSLVALVTPFKQDGSIDFEELKQLVDFHLQAGTDGLVILGTSAETATMTMEEDIAIVKYVLALAKGKIHVMVGAGSNSTAAAINRCQIFEALGADSLLVITPYYNKTNRSGAIKHFTTIAQTVKIPIIIYNVPGRTAYNLPLDVLEELSKIPNIAGIKEASGDISYAVNVSRLISDEFVMYSGNDDIIVPMMSLGAAGVISVWANVYPKVVKDLVDNFVENPNKSLEIQKKYLDFIHSLFIEVNPIPVKFAMKELGLDVGTYRLPLDEPSEETKLKIQAAIKRLKA